AGGLPLGNGAGRDPRNPGKRDKMPSLAFYPASFFQKLALSIMQTSDAASMPLLVLERIKCQGLAGTEWRTQFNHKCGSKKSKKRLCDFWELCGIMDL
ncbi:MAG: hypothetical protein II516_03195, partial [Treponema sp.]|nr:hypothetical protein [Treponema sp.]